MSDNQPTVRDAKPLFALLLGLILFLFGIAVGYMVGGKSAATPGGRGYDEGYAAAKAEIQTQLEATGLVLPAEQLEELENQPVLNVSGQILEVMSDGIRIGGTLPSFDPLTAPKEFEATAHITSDTAILLQREMTPEELDAANEEFNKALQEFDANRGEGAVSEASENLTPPMPPDMFVSEKASLSDLKVGMNVTVTSLTDMRNAAAFDASQVSFFEGAPALPPIESMPEDVTP